MAIAGRDQRDDRSGWWSEFPFAVEEVDRDLHCGFDNGVDLGLLTAF